MQLSIDEIIKISHTITMFEGYRARRPQHFQLTIQVGPWAAQVGNDQAMVIPYPMTHPRQVVSDLAWQTDGQATNHGNWLVITGGSYATTHANIIISPFRSYQPVTDRSFQPSVLANHYYLEPDQFVQSREPMIQSLAHALVPEPLPPLETLRILYKYAVDHLTYGDPIPGLYTTTQALNLSCVDCGGFSTYLAALAQACGIPARIVSGFWVGYRRNDMHAWVEAALPDGTWWPMDASIHWLRKQGRTRKLGGFGELGSDRVIINVGTHHEVRHQKKTYSVGMLQWPMQLQADGTVNYLDEVTRILTQRL